MMGFLSRFRRRRVPYAAVTEEEQISRYVYLLNTLPAGVIESAHATAFAEVPPQRRREMLEQLRPFMSDADRDAAEDEPRLLARLIRRAEESRAGRAEARPATATVEHDGYADTRDLMLRSGVMALVAYQFVTAGSVASYFTAGAGSLAIGDQPGWVGDMTGSGSTGVDAAGYSGGADAAGFGSGFDGGFGGGFDMGGGFG